MPRKLRALWWLCSSMWCVPVATQAQIGGMATTADGSALFFVTPFRLRGTAESAKSKIYVYDGAGFRLYANQFPGQSMVPSTISTPWVSADGSTVAYNGTYSLTRFCGFMRQCTSTYTDTAIQSAAGAPLIVAGPATLSADGHYAVISGPVLIDLQTAERIPVSRPAGWGSLIMSGVTSNGMVLMSDAVTSTLYLWRGGQPLRAIPAVHSQAVLDDSGTAILYTSGITLYRYDLDTNRASILANGSALSVSRDGRWVAIISPVEGIPQAWVVRSDGSQFLQLTNNPAGVYSVVISGNGNWVFVATAANAIEKYDLAGGSSSRIVPPTPAPSYYGGTRGSLNAITGSALGLKTEVATPPLPTELAGYQVMLDGRPAPLLSVSPSEIVYQVPWEVRPYTLVSIQLLGPDPRPIFEYPPGAVFIDEFLPWFFTVPCAGEGYPTTCAQGEHADGTAITGHAPARPSEVVRLKLRGLGSVFPPAPTGAAALENPAAQVQHPFACYLEEFNERTAPFSLGDLRILSLQLTPGEVGTYRMTAQLPDRAGEMPFAMIHCQGTDYYAPGWIPLKP